MSDRQLASLETVTVLFLVHPGSACGSADFNLGDRDGERARAVLVAALEGWQGGVVVIDGRLSVEMMLPRYAALNRAVTGCLDRSFSSGLPTLRLNGDAEAFFDQAAASLSAVRHLNLRPETQNIQVTGAWTHGSNGDGCVDSVQDALAAFGFNIFVRDDAIDIDYGSAGMRPIPIANLL